jgi:hypothetical protein
MARLFTLRESFQLDFVTDRVKCGSNRNSVVETEKGTDYRHVNIVRILDMTDKQIIVVRIYATETETEEFANNWLVELLMTNPVQGMKYSIERYVPKGL